MADTATFSIFRRPSPPDSGPPRLAAVPQPPPPAPAPLPEPEAEPVATPDPELEPEPGPAPTPEPTPEPARPAGPDTAALQAVALFADQLALTSPADVVLRAAVGGPASVTLTAEEAGLYRPPGFRPAPWTGFGYDHAGNSRAGVAAGTRLLTDRGERVVEGLVPGDAVMVLKSPALLPVGWVGRSMASAGIVLIEPGALGADSPRRRLRVGPDQAVFVTKSAVQAHTLVNGTTIRLEEDAAADLFHVDVGQAEILFAEGVALASTLRGPSGA